MADQPIYHRTKPRRLYFLAVLAWFGLTAVGAHLAGPRAIVVSLAAAAVWGLSRLESQRPTDEPAVLGFHCFVVGAAGIFAGAAVGVNLSLLYFLLQLPWLFLASLFVGPSTGLILKGLGVSKQTSLLVTGIVSLIVGYLMGVDWRKRSLP